MKKIAIIVAKKLLQNNVFTTIPPLDFDNYLYHQRLLRTELSKIGYDLATYDINKVEDSDFIFYYDTVYPLPLPSSKKKYFLFLWESEVISPKTYNVDLHKYFDKIFTWKNHLANSKKYIKINFSHEIIKIINTDLINKRKLCILVAGNKTVPHKLELYSKRVEAIRWFEKFYPADFDLYGRGWDHYTPSSWLGSKLYNRVSIVKKLMDYFLFKPYPSYQGELDEKIPVLEKYKFAICYENARDIPGYITEKIFHCFFAGCVPIYWGANDIDDYIPANCFIDKRQFKTYEDLYEYIDKLADEDYLEYLINIEKYLNSSQVEQFSAKTFVNTVISEIINEK